MECVRNKIKDFINDFYTHDFIGIIHNDDSSDESDFEINLDLTEKEDDKEEVTPQLLHQDTVCIVIDDD